ncbi:Eco57I restriction-modification methylase domain-containing protein [Polaribacter staleyi]|uniref:Eco57I restriction-modification methylase domain-containing protein n=1 Tax=Polaribacter staleyi TaxID=2022337 RepID=UPI0031BA5790
MSLFQPSVLKEQLNLQDKEVIKKAYNKYVKYFLNQTIQENIRSSKEEEYQGIFLTELFVNILGYTLKPKADFNLVAEYKNQTNSRKADGAILNKSIAIGVIELKGTNTKDLESIRKQAFDYKANQKGSVYVITSNFEKLRFYINDATEFEEFNLFELTPERFELFYLCLQKDNIINNVPLKIKEASIVQEEKITKEFYKDYSLFKRELYRDLVKQNAKRLKLEASLRGTKQSVDEQSKEETLEQQQLEKNVKLTLFKKSQKLIDRFLFIFFAEDRGLLPSNSTEQILEKWKADLDFGDERPLYNLFKQYFSFLDKGRQGTKSRGEIYAYNGGLFKEDTLLDNLEIDNELLYKHTHKLAGYDFESQVDVNILGHIFENSLNEIESVNAEIEGANFDKQTSKRKKDGVFYTPKYITKYIVENTVGKLCIEKKVALGIKEEEYFKGRKNRNKTTIAKLVDLLDTYRDWLLQLTICDPACGSGAFLNQALDFLIKEHTYIDELKTKVLGGGLQFSDIENTILENNIFGVDLNEESVEIAKLSLWLRTAQPRRKLNNLNSNIKCGNSLIDSKAVAGNKAFNWLEQFPKVFEKGGFDVIIGNPPYVRHELITIIKPYLQKKFKCYNGTADLYTYFYEKGIEILNENGVFSFITPNKFIESNYGKNLRQYLNNFNIIEIVDFGELQVFSDASTFPCIFTLNKKASSIFSYSKVSSLDFTDLKQVINNSAINIKPKNWIFIPKMESDLLNKISSLGKELKEYVGGEIKFGLKTGLNKAYVISSQKYQEWLKVDPTISQVVKPFINGTDSRKYFIEESNEYVIMAKIGTDLSKYDLVYNHLKSFKKELEKRSDKGNLWYEFRTCSYYNYFEASKIIYPDIALESRFSIDALGRTPNATLFLIPSDNKFLLGVLNSKVSWFYLKNNCPVIGDKTNRGRLRLKTAYISKLPIIDILDESIRSKFIELVDKIIKNSQNLYFLSKKFENYLGHKFQLQKLSKKLQNWHELEFGEFIKELNKAIKANNKLREKAALIDLGEKEGELKEGTPFVIVPTLTKKDEFEWLDLFEENKQKVQALQAQINQTDKEIDAMVYELYGLTDDEIKIVENS